MFAGTKEAVASDIKTGASNISNTVRKTASNVRDDLNQSNLEDVAYGVGQKVHDYVDTASREFTDVSKKLTTQIQESPVQSAVVALATGFLLGLLLRR